MEQDFEGLTPDEQMDLLCQINGPYTMLIALEQSFREAAEHERHHQNKEKADTYEGIADDLVGVIKRHS